VDQFEDPFRTPEVAQAVQHLVAQRGAVGEQVGGWPRAEHLATMANGAQPMTAGPK